MLCNYFWMFYLSSPSHTVTGIASLLQKSLGRWWYARSVHFLFLFLLSLNDLLIHLPFPLLELIAGCISAQSPFPTTAAHLPLSHLHWAPALYQCVGLITAILHRRSLWERKRRKFRKGEPPLSPHNLRTDRRSKAASRIYGRIGSNAISCPKDEDVHRSSWSRTFVPSLSLQGSTSSTNTVGKIISFAEAPAHLCKDSSPCLEKKLWLIAVLLNFLLSLIWAQCDEILAHGDVSNIDNNIAGKT